MKDKPRKRAVKTIMSFLFLIQNKTNNPPKNPSQAPRAWVNNRFRKNVIVAKNSKTLQFLFALPQTKEDIVNIIIIPR